MKRIKQDMKYVENKLYMTEYFSGGVISSVVADRVKYGLINNFETVKHYYADFINHKTVDHLLVSYDDCFVVVYHGNEEGYLSNTFKNKLLEYLTSPLLSKPVYLTCCHSHYYRVNHPEIADYYITDSIHENFICIDRDGNFEILNTIYCETMKIGD